MAILVQSNKKPNLTFPTLTGSIVTFNSQYAGLPLKSHKVEVVATQSGSGTPSPDNVRTINGYSAIGVSATGKNLINWESLNLHGWGGSDSDLVAQFNNLKEGNYAIQFKIKVATIMSGYDAGNYGLLIRAVNNGVNFNITMRADKTNVSEGDIFVYTATFTLSSDYVGKFTNAYYYTGRSPSNNSDYCDFYDFQVEKGSTVTDYEPFNFFATISIGSTVYGGEYDARTGMLKVTHGKSALNDLSWTYQSNESRFYSNSIASTIKRPVDNTSTIDMYCEIFDNHALGGLGNNQIAVATSGNLFVKCDYDNVTDFLSNYGDYILVYELATPTTIQLPPCPIDTLQGVNNIWADTGDTTLQYPKFG